MTVETYSGRAKTVDHARVDQLQYLGNYVRRLPVNMARMMENALDWEHLPHVHSSSFALLECVDSGKWGWRARALPAGQAQDSQEQGSQEKVSQAQEWQVLELLLDSERQYWATSVIEGPAANVEIHTQATATRPGEIEVDVRFYSSLALTDDESTLYREVLQQQYALLYDEDEQLMCDRQAALDQRGLLKADTPDEPNSVLVGSTDQLSRDKPMIVDTPGGRFCVRYFDGDWRVHTAVCPHLLGPLDTSSLSTDGVLTCPWHGYRFDVVSGKSIDGKCRGLPAPPQVQVDGNALYLAFRGS